ncbi:hypothetical protein BDE02_10G083400 [Populus trichocarpa]|nr:hypothetical protein BDE02_10G083400 [Populus trichocarpa]
MISLFHLFHHHLSPSRPPVLCFSPSTIITTVFSLFQQITHLHLSLSLSTIPPAKLKIVSHSSHLNSKSKPNSFRFPSLSLSLSPSPSLPLFLLNLQPFQNWSTATFTHELLSTQTLLCSSIHVIKEFFLFLKEKKKIAVIRQFSLSVILL